MSIDPFWAYYGFFLPRSTATEEESDSPPHQGASPFDLPVHGEAMADEDESDPALEPTEPDDELVESGGMTPALLRKIEARMAEVEKEFQPFSFSIPDDPPPHEGKMMDIPLIIDSPDLIQVEVLEALPGRPISGERLVRPDGTICLDFYGDIHVRGLTPQQAKTRIILHLRRFLTDSTLGLIEENMEYEPEASDPPEVPLPPHRVIPVPPAGGNPFEKMEEEDEDEEKGDPIDFEKLTPEQLKAIRDLLRTREQKRTRPSNFSSKSPRRTIRRVAQESTVVPRPAPVIVVPTEKGNIRIKIEVEGNLPNSLPTTGPASPQPAETYDKWNEGGTRILHPSQSDRVFVDITAHNHANYYVQGDVAAPGRLPSTGNETVLDALNYAGGFMSTADRENVRLIRPGRDGKPSKIYRIDFHAILDEGHAKSNLQIFPGDRLVVGRHPTVQSTIALDRMLAVVNDATIAMRNTSLMVKNLREAIQDSHLTPDQIQASVDAWVDVIWPTIEKGEAGVVDKKALRDALLQSILPAMKPQDESPK